MTSQEYVQHCYSKIQSINNLLNSDDTLRPAVIADYNSRLEYWEDELRIALYHYNKASKE
jgi:hypothetical protein